MCSSDLLFSELKPAPHPLNIHTTNGSTMSGHNIGFVSTSNFSIPGVFNDPNLSYHLFSVGQLVELGYRNIFDFLGVLCRIRGHDRNLGPVPELGVCFPWTTFVFQLLHLFLLLQLL